MPGGQAKRRSLGDNYETVESLYLSPALVERLDYQERNIQEWPQVQLELSLLGAAPERLQDSWSY